MGVTSDAEWTHGVKAGRGGGGGVRENGLRG